jgi:putative NADH-flavin reductase
LKVIVFGASRGVGAHAVQQALAAGHDVTAFARKAESIAQSHERLTIVAGDVTNPLDVAAAMPGHDAALVTLGADNRRAPTSLYSDAIANVIRAMRLSGARRLVALSNFGVLGETSGHPLTATLATLVRFAIRHTLVDHRKALELLHSSPVDWTAVRPMALNHGPRTGNYRVARKGLPSGGMRISRADVADFMIRQLDDKDHVRGTPALAY